MFGKGLFFLYEKCKSLPTDFTTSAAFLHAVGPTYLGLVIALNHFSLVPGPTYFKQNGVNDYQ
jgi:hypothetical protein